MAKLRLNVQVTRRESGIPIGQLSAVLENADRFLRMLAEDISLEDELKEWVAIGNKAGSYQTNVEYAGDISNEKIEEYGGTLRHVADTAASRSPELLRVRRETVLQYARIGEKIHESQRVRLGVYLPSRKDFDWCELTARDSREIIEAFPETVQFYGSAQGIIHAWYKESSPAYFQLRSLATGDLIRCTYKDEKYAEVVELLKERHRVVLLSGLANADRSTRKIKSIDVKRMAPADELTSAEFESLFGAAPGITGDLSTGEFIDRIGSGEET